MERTFNAIRENKEWLVKIGVTNDEHSMLYLQEVAPDAEFSAYERWSFDTLFIDTDKTVFTGQANLIRTTWRRSRMSINGVPQEGYQVIEVMITNPEDIKAFLKMFGYPILAAMANGLMRDLFGHNHLPLIDTRAVVNGAANPNYGLPFVVTEYQQTIEPTWDYNSWKEGDPLPEILTEPIAA